MQERMLIFQALCILDAQLNQNRRLNSLMAKLSNIAVYAFCPLHYIQVLLIVYCIIVNTVLCAM